jgi:hypothetical protein
LELKKDLPLKKKFVEDNSIIKERFYRDRFKLKNEKILSDSDIINISTKFMKKKRNIEYIKAIRKRK